MRPLKLEVQAFGPFAGKEEVDFTKLGENPLFLINGPTGAGKSSILDAICFALYGQTTGAERQASQMRCDHSDLAILTQVTFEFSIAHKSYRIRRSPTQERPKSRGEGTTTQQAQAQLWESNGEAEGQLIVSKSVKDADTKINELIGLGVDQFRQVMVLPQGKFRELLMADSKERETIFSQLFETQIYKKIENKLKEHASGIRQKVEQHRNEVRGMLHATNVESENALQEEKDALKPKLLKAEKEKNGLSERLGILRREHDLGLALNQRFDELKLKKNELGLLNSRESEFKEKSVLLEQSNKAQSIYHLNVSFQREAAQLNNVQLQLKAQSSTLKATKEAHDQASTQLDQARLAEQSLDELKTQLSDLQRHSKQNDELVAAKEEVKAKIELLNRHQQKKAAKEDELALLDKEVAENNGLIEKYASEVEHLVSQEHRLKHLKQVAEERKQFEQLNHQLVQLNTKKETAEVKVHEQEARLVSVKNQLVKTEIAWHQGQAVLLAKELKDDEPCPVCGSKNHPSPASEESDFKLVTKQEVEQARQLEVSARDALQGFREELSGIITQQTLVSEKCRDLRERLGDYADKELNEIDHDIANTQSIVNDLQSKRTKMTQLAERSHVIKDQVAGSQQTMSTLQSQVEQANADVIASKTKLEQLEKQVPEHYRDCDLLTAEIVKITDRINSITKQVTEAGKRFQEQQSQLDRAISTEKSLAQQLEQQKLASDQAAAEWKEALDKSDFEDVEAFNSVRLEKEQQASLKRELDIYQAEINRLSGVIEQLEVEVLGKERFDVVSAEQKIKEVEQEFKAFDDQWRQLQNRYSELNRTEKMLEQAKEENALLNQQYAVYGTLYDVASGNTGNKISLQRFVLSVLLDDVLIQASQRLHLMSHGRYQLVRKEDRSKGNKASGLELEVEDGNTGKPRPVATLSGGESFMAALALALGLSDVVQSYAGGIKLDTLFIDEGFGSLDMESLDSAVKVLIDLQATGRTIGIISHVSELKEQMAMRVDVVSSQSGSHISTIAA